jgi:predicted nucleic-acid-binding Zn-ribbon protein
MQKMTEAFGWRRWTPLRSSSPSSAWKTWLEVKCGKCGASNWYSYSLDLFYVDAFECHACGYQEWYTIMHKDKTKKVRQGIALSGVAVKGRSEPVVDG